MDPADPNKDIWGKNSYPGVDGVNIWDMLMNPTRYEFDAAHETLVLTREVILKGRYKLMTSQRGTSSDTTQVVLDIENQWIDQNYKWWKPDGWQQTCGFPIVGVGTTHKELVPCLIDLESDDREMNDLAPTQPELMNRMWAELNYTWLSAYRARSPPELLGYCDETCAYSHWSSFLRASRGPACDVPECSPAGDGVPAGPMDTAVGPAVGVNGLAPANSTSNGSGPMFPPHESE